MRGTGGRDSGGAAAKVPGGRPGAGRGRQRRCAVAAPATELCQSCLFSCRYSAAEGSHAVFCAVMFLHNRHFHAVDMPSLSSGLQGNSLFGPATPCMSRSRGTCNFLGTVFDTKLCAVSTSGKGWALAWQTRTVGAARCRTKPHYAEPHGRQPRERGRACAHTRGAVRGAGLTAGPAAGDASGVGPALARAFRAVDSQVLRAARADGKDYGSTATVALCFTAQRTLYVAHVGDSRSVLARRAAAAAQP